MNRAAVIDNLEEAFAQLGYATQSEPGAKRLSMTHPDGSRMSAETSEGSNYGYLHVDDRQDTLLQIRLGKEGPWIHPHRLRDPQGRELLQYLIESCPPFQQDWLMQYIDDVVSGRLR